MYRIGIVEVKCENHEVADLCRMADPVKNHVTLFTTERLLPQIREELKESVDLVEMVVKREDERFSHFLKRASEHCSREFDLVVINSLRLWQFLYFRPTCPVISVLSSLNWWFLDTKSIRNYFRKMLDWGNFQCPDPLINPVTGPFIRRVLLSRLSGVIVEYPAFINLITQTFGWRKPVFFLPNRPFGGFPEQSGHEKLTFCVPGMISDYRRDYDVLLDALEMVSQTCKENLRLILLGKPLGDYGKRIQDRCARMKKQGYDIDCAEGFVPAPVLEEKLTGTDVIVSPLTFSYRSRTVTEAYTYTKGTGVFSDGIKYGKPSIVPEQYNVSEDVKDYFLKYRDKQHLAQMLETSVADRAGTLALGQQTREYYSSRFSLERLQDDFQAMVRQMLTSETLS